jgi:hypothetical protein
MALALCGAQTFIRAAKPGCTGFPKIDLPGLAATMTEHGRLGCALDNETGEQGIDDER